MTMRKYSNIGLFSLATLLLLFATSAPAADWGTLTGRVVYDGTPPKAEEIPPTKDQEVCGKSKIYDEGLLIDKSGGVANAVIMLKTKLDPKKEVNPDYEKTASDKVVLDNKGCRFEPHVAVLRNSQTLELHNSDPVSHNTKIDPLNNPGINPILAAGGDPIMQKFGAEEGLPVKVGCNIHPWMGGYIVVRKDPYAAVTDATGKFELKDLPAGKDLEFVLWEEKPGYLKNAAFKGGKADARGRFKIKLKPGETKDLGDIKVSGSMFKK
jgi:hypothetical protein